MTFYKPSVPVGHNLSHHIPPRDIGLSYSAQNTFKIVSESTFKISPRLVIFHITTKLTHSYRDASFVIHLLGGYQVNHPPNVIKLPRPGRGDEKRREKENEENEREEKGIQIEK